MSPWQRGQLVGGCATVSSPGGAVGTSRPAPSPRPARHRPKRGQGAPRSSAVRPDSPPAPRARPFPPGASCLTRQPRRPSSASPGPLRPCGEGRLRHASSQPLSGARRRERGAVRPRHPARPGRCPAAWGPVSSACLRRGPPGDRAQPGPPGAVTGVPVLLGGPGRFLLHGAPARPLRGPEAAAPALGPCQRAGSLGAGVFLTGNFPAVVPRSLALPWANPWREACGVLCCPLGTQLPGRGTRCFPQPPPGVAGVGVSAAEGGAWSARVGKDADPRAQAAREDPYPKADSGRAKGSETIWEQREPWRRNGRGIPNMAPRSPRRGACWGPGGSGEGFGHAKALHRDRRLWHST